MTTETFQVLIADDDADMRNVLRHVIDKAEGFTLVGEAADGEETMRLFEALKPHVVFLDVEMPASWTGSNARGKYRISTPRRLSCLSRRTTPI